MRTRRIGVWRWIARVAAGVGLLLAVVPAEGGQDERVPVLYLGQTTDAAAQLAGQEVKGLLGLTDEEVAPALPLVKYAAGGAILWPVGAPAVLCTPDREEVDLEVTIAAAEEAVATVSFPDAIELLQPVVEEMACVAGVVTGERLSRAAYLLGYVRFQEGDAEGASSAFRAAAALDPAITWDNDFPPEAQQTFNNAVLESLRLAGASVSPPDGSTDLALDGVTLTQAGALSPGWHQVQVPTADGASVRVAVDVPAGGSLQFVPTGELFAEMLDGGRHADAAVGALAAALLQGGAAEAYVADMLRHRVYRVRAASSSLIGPLGGRRGTRPLSKSGAPNPGPVLVVSGAAAGIAGLAIGLGQRSAAIGVYDDAVAAGSTAGLEDDYDGAVRGATFGFVLAGVGAAVAAVGIPIWITSARKGVDRTAWLRVSWSRGFEGDREATLWLTGRW